MALFAWNQAESWTPLVQALDGKRVRFRGLLNTLPTVYDGVLAYHGCRPLDVGLYYTNGLARSSSSSLDIRAREIFSSGAFPDLTKDKVEAAIARLGSRDNGRIFACLDRDHLIEQCGHYLIYGSERLCAIAANLCDGHIRDYRQVLKRFGTPTVFHIALKWEQMSEAYMEALARNIASNMARIRRHRKLPMSFMSFEFYEALPGPAILLHEHPESIADPLLGMDNYKFRKDMKTE